MSGRIVYALVGATATGKTEVGARVAASLDAEVVCADSRQVFRELDVGTGKPDARERGGRPHHLFEALAIEQRPSAGWYAREAAAVIEGIFARGRSPLLVGGAGLYVQALRFGLAPEPPLDPEARVRLRRDHQALPVAALRELLERRDPAAAARLGPRDRQRISRALEVVELSGRTLGWWQAQPTRSPLTADWSVVELRLAPAALAPRVARRARWMFEHGLLDEAAALKDAGREGALRALHAVGYDEALDVLAGTRAPGDAERRTIERTLQLAKRQRTWFRHQLKAAFVEGAEAPDVVTARALDALRAHAASG